MTFFLLLFSRFNAVADGVAVCCCNDFEDSQVVDKLLFLSLSQQTRAAGYNTFIAGAISCDSSLIKISLFGLEFMTTISVKPNRTYLSSFFIASSALDTTRVIFSIVSIPTACALSSILRGS